jgi:hypothetical protein
MNWELYEVWAVDVDGREELVETTKSMKEARVIAQTQLELEDCTKCYIYKEDEEGDLIKVETIR